MAGLTGKTASRRGAIALSLICVLAASLLSSASAAPVDVVGERAVPGEIIVRFKPAAGASVRAATLAEAGVTTRERLLLEDTRLVATVGGSSVASALDVLNAHPAVRYAEPNLLYETLATPNDPRFGDQWPLRNTGQTIQGVTGTPNADISAAEAWDTATGSASVKLAVLDTGIDYFHPDLAANIWRNPGEAVAGEELNGVDNDGNGFLDDLYGWDFTDHDRGPSDTDGHGTAVASVAGAVGNNARGMTGVNWNVSLVPLRIETNGGISRADAIQAARYAGMVGADVANMSFGGDTDSFAFRDAIAASSNTLFVAAAGNGDNDNDANPFYPCAYDVPNLICVTGTTSRDEQIYNHGQTTVDLGAPAVSVVAATIEDTEPFTDDFEGLAAKWDYTEAPAAAQAGKWRRTAGASTAHMHVLEEGEQGIDYANGADVRATTTAPIDLVGEDGCFVRLEVLSNTESSRDYVRVEAGTTPSGPFTELTRGSGDSREFAPLSASLAAFEGGNVYLRLRFTSDVQNTDDGVMVDNVQVRCGHPTDAYWFVEGTSIAAPQVAGAAALVKSHMPSLSVTALRDRILRTVDPLPSLEGKTVTGGRLNVARALTADLDAPAASITAQPPALTSSSSGEFRFASPDTTATFECRLDSDAFAECASPKQYAALTDGQHNFAVRALDPSGNVGQPAQAAWTVDTTGPAVAITDGPADSTSERSASFAFTSAESVEAFECSLDGGAFAVCSSPAPYDSLAAGQHAFAVRARDAAGNWTATPASRAWTVVEPPPGDQPPPEDPDNPLPPPDPSDPGPTAWSPPALAIEVPAGQTIRRTLRRGLKTMTTATGECGCKLGYVLRLDTGLARSVGLIGRRAAEAGRRPVIGRAERALQASGRVALRVELSDRARRRLAHVARLRAILTVKLTDRFGRAIVARRSVRLADAR
jgi:subtilisin family serine protease